MAALLCAIFAARLASRIISPLAGIILKWIVIGRYKPGKYKMYVLSSIFRAFNSSGFGSGGLTTI
jgi:hypothetical protein